MIQGLGFLAAVSLLAAPDGQAVDGPRDLGKVAAGTVESCTFPTRSLPPPFHVPARFAEGYKLFQAGSALLPEGTMVKSVVLMGNSRIGLTAKETQGLYANLDQGDLKILMINGKHDPGLPIATVKSIAAKLADRLPHFRIHVLDGDHFFLLSKREETFRVIKDYLGQEAGNLPAK